VQTKREQRMRRANMCRTGVCSSATTLTPFADRAINTSPAHLPSTELRSAFRARAGPVAAAGNGAVKFALAGLSKNASRFFFLCPLRRRSDGAGDDHATTTGPAAHQRSSVCLSSALPTLTTHRRHP
jgi:hypothetical protein